MQLTKNGKVWFASASPTDRLLSMNALSNIPRATAYFVYIAIRAIIKRPGRHGLTTTLTIIIDS